jgi:hypothetical protein
MSQERFEDSIADSSDADRAISARLAKLRTMPVDTSSLDNRLRAALDLAHRPSSAGRTSRLRLGWSDFTKLAAAAVILLATLVGVIVMTSGGPALASPTQMAKVHEDIVSGRTPVMQVDSIDAAGRMLAKQWPDSPDLPGVPAQHVMACCMKSVKDKKMACVLLKKEGVPITMAVARSVDMRLPSSPTRKRDGMTYHVQSAGNLNMVMTERADRWICLIGEMPQERLMDLADQLKF